MSLVSCERKDRKAREPSRELSLTSRFLLVGNVPQPQLTETCGSDRANRLSVAWDNQVWGSQAVIKES